MLGSPVQRLMGRRTKTLLPTTQSQLSPKIIPQKTVKSGLLKQQSTQKQNYDKSTRSLPPLKIGEKVRFRCGDVWQPAVITKLSHYPRSYVITTPSGQTYCRNRRRLRPAHVLSDRDDDSSDEEIQANNTPEGHDTGNNVTSATNGASATSSGMVTPLRRSTRTTSRPHSYANPYTRHYQRCKLS